MGNVNKIIIAGFSGAGKTTLAGKISEEILLPHIDTDRKQFTQKMKKKEKEERIKLFTEICSKDKWIIDSMLSDIAEQFIRTADLIIFINIGLFTNTKNVIKRKILNIMGKRKKFAGGRNKRIKLKNIKRIWTNRKGFKQFWGQIIEDNSNYFKVIVIKKVNKRNIRYVINTIKKIQMTND